jgi:1-acyl-sn-glycerol-3-phosphate acyltransferase
MGEQKLHSNRRWMDGFCWYARKMVRQSFTVFAVDDHQLEESPIAATAPLIVYANHPGWWDPIVAMLLCRQYFPQRSYFAPIDETALKKYRVFKKLGYFGIDLSSKRGAASFLDSAAKILAMNGGSLWITPEGKFTDSRDPNPPFMPGIAHLASKNPSVTCLPLAIEYPFFEEKLPLMLCRFGSPIRCDSGNRKEDLSKSLEIALRETQQHLANSVVQRSWSEFRVLLQSKGPKHGSIFVGRHG